MSKPYIVVGGKRHPIVHGIKLGKSAKFLDGYVKITADSIDAADKDHVHSQYITNITSKMITDALGYTPSKNVEVIDNLESTSTDSALSANQGKALKDLVDAKQPKGDYASASHTHDWDSVTGKPTTYPPTSHNHDERYYTETEIDTKMSGKSNTGHTHAWNTITGKPDTFAPSSHKHTSDDIESLDADKITGKINIENLPAGALERCVHVADDKARFALTTEYVQLGDTVKVESTGLMYYVIDIANLNSEDGYDVYTAGSASTVPWSGVTGKPDTFTPSTHTHDDRYYTESEIDTKLGTKANANHTHTQYLTEINSKMVTDALGYTPPTADTNTVTNVGTSSSNYTNGNILIQGSGATSVSKNGNTITISSTDNNTVYTHPTYTSKTSGLYKVTVDSTGHVSATSAVTKADITNLGIPATDTNTWRPQPDWNATSGDAVILNKPTSLPASDVYSWAKASTKPTYTASEVGALSNTNAYHGGTLKLASNGTSSDHVKLDETQIPVALDILSGVINAMDVYEGGEKLTEKYAAKSHTHSQYITGITSNMITTALGYTPPSTNTTYSASTGLNLSGTAFSVKYGTAAGTACQGNDSRLSNSRPASDVYSWAKASTKPTYTASEVGALSTAGGTLTGGIKLPGSSSKGISLTNSYAYPAQIYVSDKSLRLNSVSSGSFGAAGIEISSCGNGIFPYAVSPSGNGYITWAQNLGSSSRKWGTIYSTSSSLNSDKKEKKDITKLNECELNEKYVDAFENIDFVKFRWKNNKNGGLEVPASSRFHYGIIAQDIEKLLNDLGIDNYDNGIIKSAFFLDNTSDTFITGGYQPRFINEESNITYDYSENVYNYKHGNEYEIYNEIIEKDLTNYDKFGLYLNRQNISYIMIEDNSKLDHDNTQPPITIKNIMLVNSDGEYKTLSLNEGVSYYESDDENKENPKTSGTKNDDGTITITFSKKYSTYMIKVDEFVLSEYTKILLNVDYVGEYKIYLIPTAEKEHVNANVWDRARVDDTMLTYSVDYNELHNMCLYAAQQKIKQQESEISVLKSEIQEIKELLGNA